MVYCNVVVNVLPSHTAHKCWMKHGLEFHAEVLQGSLPLLTKPGAPACNEGVIVVQCKIKH